MAGQQQSWVAEVATQLHAWRCHSRWWSEDCQRPDGGQHARETMRPRARKALKQQDPIAYLHDEMCDAMLDRALQGCRERDRHIEHMRRILGDPPAMERPA